MRCKGDSDAESLKKALDEQVQALVAAPPGIGVSAETATGFTKGQRLGNTVDNPVVAEDAWAKKSQSDAVGRAAPSTQALEGGRQDDVDVSGVQSDHLPEDQGGAGGTEGDDQDAQGETQNELDEEEGHGVEDGEGDPEGEGEDEEGAEQEGEGRTDEGVGADEEYDVEYDQGEYDYEEGDEEDFVNEEGGEDDGEGDGDEDGDAEGEDEEDQLAEDGADGPAEPEVVELLSDEE
jgi:hypothetical protein